jgi:hypothetical protein
MATNTDFLKILIKDVTFHWPRLDQPYRYNSQDKRTEACAPTVQNAGYSIAWDMPTADAKALFGELKKHYLASRAANPKLPEFSKVFGMVKDEETGTVRFTAKKRAVNGKGDANKPPVVIDGAKRDLADKTIWSGSKGNLRVLAFAVTDPDGAGGISLLLDTVQVVEAVYGGDGLDDFDGVATPAAKPLTADDDFGDAPPPARQAAKPAPATADADF